MCLRFLHVTALSFTLFRLVHAPCFLCPTAVAKRLTTSRWWISSDTIFLLFNVDSLEHQRCRCRPRPAFPFATVPIISFILRADSAFSTAIFAFHFRPVITEGWEFFTSGSRESRSIRKSRAIYIYIYCWSNEVNTVKGIGPQMISNLELILILLLLFVVIVLVFLISVHYTRVELQAIWLVRVFLL